MAFFSKMTTPLSWGFGLIFAGIPVSEIVRNVRGIDYRAIGAAENHFKSSRVLCRAARACSYRENDCGNSQRVLQYHFRIGPWLRK